MCLELLGLRVGMNFRLIFMSLWYLPLISTEVSVEPFYLTTENNQYLVNFRPRIKYTEQSETELLIGVPLTSFIVSVGTVIHL